MDVFNNIHVTKEDSDGNILKDIRVPIAFARRQKYLARIQEDQMKNPDTTQAKTELSLPRMSCNITTIDPNPAAQLSPHTLQVRELTEDGLDEFLKQMSPTPIQCGIDLSIYTYQLDDMLQIIEQIIPYFVPDLNVNILDIPALDISKDVPIKLDSINTDDTFEGAMDEYRIIEWSISFTTNIDIYPPIKQGGVIRRAITNYYINEDKKESSIEHVLNPFDTKLEDDYVIDTTHTLYP